MMPRSFMASLSEDACSAIGTVLTANRNIVETYQASGVEPDEVLMLTEYARRFAVLRPLLNAWAATLQEVKSNGNRLYNGSPAADLELWNAETALAKAWADMPPEAREPTPGFTTEDGRLMAAMQGRLAEKALARLHELADQGRRASDILRKAADRAVASLRQFFERRHAEQMRASVAVDLVCLGCFRADPLDAPTHQCRKSGDR